MFRTPLASTMPLSVCTVMTWLPCCSSPSRNLYSLAAADWRESTPWMLLWITNCCCPARAAGKVITPSSPMGRFRGPEEKGRRRKREKVTICQNASMCACRSSALLQLLCILPSAAWSIFIDYSRWHTYRYCTKHQGTYCRALTGETHCACSGYKVFGITLNLDTTWFFLLHCLIRYNVNLTVHFADVRLQCER